MKATLTLLAVAAASSGFASGAAYSITQSLLETKGTTTNITSSGNKENTTTFPTISGTSAVVGRFLVSDGTNTYGLEVSVSNPTGSLQQGQDSLMVARTTNSQGLTDTGTLSIYVSPGDASVASGEWSLDVRFSFFNVEGTTFTTAFSPTLLLTSLDIDANQRYYTDNADFSANNLYAGSTLSSASAITGYTGFTAGGSANFNDPASAVSSLGAAGVSEFDVRLQHNNVALFMFEFRDPSQIVPEPSAAVLLGAFATIGLLRRRTR